MSFFTIGAYLIGLLLLYILGRALVVPIRILIKLLINGLIGGVVLLIFNLVGGIFGLAVAVNPLNAIIAGILGIPGVILILIVQMIL